jgi:flagellar assembly protein FliH
LMGHDVLSSRDYEYIDQGYLIDNGPWQEKIKKMTQRQKSLVSVEPWPTLGLDEFKPNFLPENAEAEGAQSTAANVFDPVAEAEEKAKTIEQNAKKSAYEVVERARWEADDILNTAKEEAEREAGSIRETAKEQGQKEGFDNGRQDGFAQGEIEGKNSYSDLIKNLNGLMGNLTTERKKIVADLQPLIVELVGEALKRCLNKEAENGNLIVGFVREALSKAQDKVHLSLHLNPDDMAEIEVQKKQLQLTVGVGEMELIADARVERGGCLLETEGGSIDVRLNSVVEQIKESLISEMKK